MDYASRFCRVCIRRALDKDAALVSFAEALVADSDGTTQLATLIEATTQLPPALQEFSRPALWVGSMQLQHCCKRSETYTTVSCWKVYGDMAVRASPKSTSLCCALVFEGWDDA